MTQTSTHQAEITIAHLPINPTHADYLGLIEASKTELEALEAGMVNQTAEANRLSNAMWSAQHQAQHEIVKEALAAGGDRLAIMAITHRER